MVYRSFTCRCDPVNDRTRTADDRDSVAATKEGPVPLSEHEQKLLDQIEQALYAEDPKFAASVRSARTRSRTRRSVLACVFGVLVGMALVLVGLVAQIIALSVVGFVFVVLACGYAVQALRGHRSSATAAGSAGPRPTKQAGLRTRMEDRLRRRFDEG
jgi:Flp pilus assembly protein TadB